MSWSYKDGNALLPYFSDYTSIEFHYEGGFKLVYKAQKKDGIFEALKLVQMPIVDDSEEGREEMHEYSGRVVREIKTLSQCKSQHIVKLGSIDPNRLIIEGVEFVVYSEDFLHGSNLANLIGNAYKPDDAELRLLCIQMLDAIDDMWTNQGIVHRDIKPLNIIKTPIAGREFVLLDLGIAYAVSDTNLTANASRRPPLGTMSYIAPEFFNSRHRDSIDYRSDLYTLGLTLYEYASGKHPFRKYGATQQETWLRIKTESPQSIRDFRDDLRPELVAHIDGFIKKHPALRPSRIETIINKLKD